MIFVLDCVCVRVFPCPYVVSFHLYSLLDVASHGSAGGSGWFAPKWHC
jgi:hypothetical protein